MNEQPLSSEQIVKALMNTTMTFPREALEAAIAQREAIVPELLRILETSLDIEFLLNEDAYMAHFYAMYLLAQFRESRAYPLLVAFFSTPGEIVHDVTGDFITEDLGRVLASVCAGDMEPLKRMIEDPQVDEYVRDAAIEALVILVARGEKSRDEVMAYFQSLFRGGLERAFSHVWNGLVAHSTDLYPEEILPDIQQAFADGLVDTFFIGLDSVTATLARPKEEILTELPNNRSYTLIQDAISEMEGWYCFQSPARSPVALAPKPRPAPAPQPKKVGRNDPCPCGSGKKYKHCCGSKRNR